MSRPAIAFVALGLLFCACRSSSTAAAPPAATLAFPSDAYVVVAYCGGKCPWTASNAGSDVLVTMDADAARQRFLRNADAFAAYEADLKVGADVRARARAQIERWIPGTYLETHFDDTPDGHRVALLVYSVDAPRTGGGG